MVLFRESIFHTNWLHSAIHGDKISELLYDLLRRTLAHTANWLRKFRRWQNGKRKSYIRRKCVSKNLISCWNASHWHFFISSFVCIIFYQHIRFTLWNIIHFEWLPSSFPFYLLRIWVLVSISLIKKMICKRKRDQWFFKQSAQ